MSEADKPISERFRLHAVLRRVDALEAHCRVGPGNFTPSLSQIRT
jgi:hypothetical protein